MTVLLHTLIVSHLLFIPSPNDMQLRTRGGYVNTGEGNSNGMHSSVQGRMICAANKARRNR